jgi:kojibiose phosphorylase
MARWNLRHGAETVQWLRERWPEQWSELASRLQFADQEVSTWVKLAESMFIPFDPRTLLYEQFHGYFDKEPIDLESYEPRSAAMDMILGHARIQQTNVVKQADVVLATYLLWDEISPEVRAANFRYYEPHTGHGSSLSPCIHALVAARMGDASLAQRYLRQASEIDLGNNMGNAAGGVHAAALGGLWQAVVFGFAGVRTQADGVSFAPNLLSNWRRLAFPLVWRKRQLRVSIEPRLVRIWVSGDQPLSLRIEAGPAIRAVPGNEYVSERTERGWQFWRVAQRREQL